MALMQRRGQPATCVNGACVALVINCSVYNRSRNFVVEVLLYTHDEALVCAPDEPRM